jgi:hypothetical protein
MKAFSKMSKISKIKKPTLRVEERRKIQEISAIPSQIPFQ